MRVFETSDDLERLVSLCRGGDERAWATLVERFQRLVYSIPRRMGLGDDDAADVFQATFVALFRSLDRIDSPKTLPKWLSVTASRESLRIRRIGNAARTSTSEQPQNLEEIVAAEEQGAESMAVEACEANLLRDATQRLGGRCRDLLAALYFEDDVTYADLSERLAIPVGAIGPTRSRCLGKLRKLLETEGFFDQSTYFADRASASYGQEP